MQNQCDWGSWLLWFQSDCGVLPILSVGSAEAPTARFCTRLWMRDNFSSHTGNRLWKETRDWSKCKATGLEHWLNDLYNVYIICIYISIYIWYIYIYIWYIYIYDILEAGQIQDLFSKWQTQNLLFWDLHINTWTSLLWASRMSTTTFWGGCVQPSKTTPSPPMITCSALLDMLWWATMLAKNANQSKGLHCPSSAKPIPALDYD